jgi:cell division septation protein DedD
LLDQLPAPTRIGATRVGGVDLNKPRIRAALSAALALSAAPEGFTVAEFTAKVHAMTGDTDYTSRQGAYDLRKLRGKDLVVKPGRSRRYHLLTQAASTIPARSPCATRSSAPSSPVSAAHGSDANPPPGPASTATTNSSASTCKPCSTTSASPQAPPRHRQHLVDRDSVSA